MSKPTKRRKLYEEEKQAKTIEPNQLESEEMFLTAMELKIKEFPLMTEVVSSIIDPLSEVFEDKAVRKFEEKELHLMNWAKENIDRMLGLAVKYEKIDIVNFLIKCGANVNATDGDGKTAADYAWMNKNYRILMLLLKADSFFPAGFNLSELSEDDDGDNIRQLVGKRSKLHEAIENGEVEDVKNLTMNENSKLFLNDKNESGAYIALKHKKFVIYAYLKSIGADFGKDGEAGVIDTFDFKEIVALQEAMVAYFPGVTDAPIHYLISKSRSHKPVLNLADKLKYHYSFLNEIPEISLILKVVQYADYLDIIFDFDEEEISKVYPHYTSKDCMRGITQQRIGRIYIAASLRKRKRVEVLGTVAHELTHMAMQMLFENDCNPYGKDNLEKDVLDTVSFFKQFKDRIRQVSGEPSKILLDAIDKYKDFDHDSELIVRVPHILAQYENGRDWLKTQIPEFLKFYEQKIVPKCQDFIRESVILKPKSMIKSINDSVGELQKLKRCKMFFNDAPNIFENTNKKIFVIEVESTLLGMLKVLQRLYGRGYVNFHSHFLVLKFENFVSQLTEISQAFFLEGCEWLIIEISYKQTEDKLEKVCYKISQLLDYKPHKKIIFVVHPKVTKYLRSELDGMGLLNISDEISDDCLRLDDLDKNSQELILRNKVFFQGKSIFLNKLIQVPELYQFINPQIIESILEGRKVNIGNRILGSSSLEGPYSDIIREMDFNSFVRHVENSRDIFIMRSKPTQALTEYLNANFKEKWISTEFYKSLIYNFERKIGSEEKILLVNDRFRSDDLKNFCRLNPGKKCHLVDVKDLSTGSFVLKEIYNPNFYLKRRMKKIFINSDRMTKLIHESKSEIFILSSVVGSKRYIFQGHSNVKCLDDKQAEENFKILSQQHKDVHWFKMENEQFTWKNSHGPTTSIKYIFKEIKADEESEEYDEDWEAELPENDEDESDLDHSNEYQKELRKQRAESRVLKEENLVSEILHKRIMLISDNPGTGKSTTITKLYEAKAISDTHWIIRINLKDYLKVIRFNIASKELDIEKIVRFLQDIDQSLKDELNENLLKEALTNGHDFPKCLLLAFDGYDEVIDDEDRQKVIDLLKFLKKETQCKIWITSRLQYKQDLEYHLETFALEFDPFDYEMKKMFVEKYLKDRLKLILTENLFSEIFDGEKIEIFARKLLSKMRKIFMKDLTKFVGTPLQLNLVMFGSLDYFIKWTQGDEQSASLDFNYLGNDLQGVYENFIRQKYEIYFKKCDIIIRKRQKRDKRIAEEYHKDLAESLIYERKMLAPDDDDKEINLLVGLIQSQGENNFEFIHFTFREYYFAETFANYVMTEELMDESNSKKVVFLFREIFVKREFEMIRSFFNIRFKQKIPDENIKELKKTFSDNEIIGFYTTLDSVLAVAAHEGCENNFNFFYSIYSYVFSSAPSYEITNILNRPLFSISAIAGKSEIWESLFRILKDVKLEKKWEEFYFKCLISESAHYATETKFWKLAKSLLENMKETFAPGEMRDFLTALDTKYATLYKIMEKGSSAEVFEFVMEILTKEEQHKFITMPNQHGPSALFAAAKKKDPRFMELLLEKSEELMVREDFIRFISSQNNVENWLNHTFKATILHEAAWAGRLETIRLIFDKIENLFDVNQQINFFMAKNIKNRNALCNAVFQQRIAVVKFLISKAEKILTDEQLWEYITIAEKWNKKKWNKTILHLSIDSSNKIYIDLIKFIIQEAKRILPQEKLEQWMMMVEYPGPDSDLSGSVLHRACVLGDVEILKYLLLEAHEILPPDRFQQFIKARNGLESNVFHLISKPNKPDAVKVLFEKLEAVLPPDDIIQLIMAKNCYGTILHEALFWGKMQTIETFITKTEKLLNPSQFRQLLMTKGSRRYFEMIFLRWVLVNPIELVLFVWEKIQNVIIPDDLRQILLEKDMQYPNALYVALSNEDSKVLEFVMEQFERVLDEDKQRELLMTIGFSKRTILHTAVVKHLSESLRVMLEKMKDLLTEDELQQVLMNQDADGNTVLHAAAADDNPDLLKVFLDKTKEIASEKQRALFLLKNNDNEYCLSAGKIVDVKLEILKLLFERIQEIFPVQDQRLYFLESNNRGTIFHKAADFAKGDVLHFLFDKTKEIFSPEDRRRLMTEEINFRLYFLNFTMTPDFRNTILHIAAYSGKPEVIKTLLKNIDKEYERQLFMSQNQEDQTPLHAILSSCFSIEIEAVELLLEKLNQILTPEDWFKLLTIKDKINGTVLHSTALMNEIEIVILILKTIEKHLTAEGLGQLLLIKDDELGSVLQAALYNEDPKVAKFILNKAKEVLNKEERSALLVTTDKSSRTALHTAASVEEPELKWDRRELTVQSTQDEFLKKLNDRTEFVYFFLTEAEELMTKEERGRFLDMKDSNGKTALHAAAQDGKLEAVKLLLQEAEKIIDGEALTNFVTAKDSGDKTALNLSSSANDYLIRNLLEKFTEEKIK